MDRKSGAGPQVGDKCPGLSGTGATKVAGDLEKVAHFSMAMRRSDLGRQHGQPFDRLQSPPSIHA